jgi:hypothetical protein
MCGHEFTAFEDDTSCPHCGGASQRVLGPFGIGAGALETKMAEVRATQQRETNLDYDRAAYKRFRKQGVQPATIDGAYDMERRAATKREVETGKVQPDPMIRAKQQTGDSISKDLGIVK